MTLHRAGRLAVLTSILLLSTRPSLAQEGDDAAAGWLRQGNTAFREGRFAAAEHAYGEAWKLKQGYDIAGNLGAAELAQGKLRQAAEHLAFTLRLFPITGDPALRERMAAAFERCQKGVGTVHVDVRPAGAEVWVDGALRGPAPLADDVFLDPGEHVVEARMPGHAPAHQLVMLRAGGEVPVALVLRPLPPAPRVVRLPEPRRRSLVPALSMAGAALAGVGTGAALLGVSAARKADAATVRSSILGQGGSCVAGAGNFDGGRCGELASGLRADDRLHDVAVGAFVVGGALAVGAATYLLWPEKKAASGRELRVSPVFGDKGGAVILRGAF